jgi:hypothetical protein
VIAVFVAGLLVPAGVIVGVTIGVLLSSTFPRTLNTLVVDAVILGGSVVMPILTILIGRDRWFRRALREHLRAARCPRCRYDLLGLPAQDGDLCCPECGTRIALTELGLSREALLATKRDHARAD